MEEDTSDFSIFFLQSQEKLFWEEDLGKVFVITEAQLIWCPLCMMRLLVYIWLSLRTRMGKEEQTHADIMAYAILQSGCAVISLK